MIVWVEEKLIRLYATSTGRCPVAEWLEALDDRRGRNVIETRINRLRLGNMGDCKSIGGGLHELRIDFGPAYRLYFVLEGNKSIVLLLAGTKASQKRDIRKARKYYQDLRSFDKGFS